MDFKKNLLSLAVATVVASGPVAAVAADVVNLLGSEGGKLNISLHADHSNRDVKQDGSTTLLDEAGFYDAYVDEFDNLIETEGEISASVRNLKAEERQQHLYLQIAYAVSPRIQVYGKAGMARTKLHNMHGATVDESWSETTFVNGSFDEYDEGWYTESDLSVPGGKYGDWGALVSVGANVQLWESPESGWRAGLDLSYQYKNQDADWSAGGLDFTGSESQEWQAALVMSKAMGKFNPYFGLKLSKAKTDYEGQTDLYYGSDKWTLKMENDQPLGLFAGFNYDLTPGMGITAQVRAVDDTAGNLGFYWKF